jgi:hypothetical protein
MGAFTGLPQPATSNPMVAELLNLSPGAKAALAGAASAAAGQQQAGSGAPAPAAGPPPPGRLLPMAMPQGAARMDAGGAVAKAGMPEGAPPSPEPLHMPPAMAMPQLGAAPSLPDVKAPLGTPEGDMAERARLIETGRPVSHIAQRVEDSDFGQNHPKWAKLLGNVGQVGAEVGDTLLSHVLPAATNALLGPAAGVVVRNIAQDVPGTTARHNYLLNQANTHIGQDQKDAQGQAALKDTESQTAQREATAVYQGARPSIEEGKLDQKNQTLWDHLTQVAATNGMKVTKDEDGNPVFTPDETSPVYQTRQLKDQLTDAEVASTKAQTEVRTAEAELKRAGNDPNSPAYKLAEQRLAVAQANSAAAQLRATAYMGNYLQHAYNHGLHGDVLPGAPIITSDDGTPTVVGSTNAPTAIKDQANVAQFGDVHGAVNSLETAARDLVAKGGSLHSAGVAAALAVPHDTFNEWVQGFGKLNLSPEERNYVTALAAAHENVQAMRKAAGGTATDSAVDKLDALLPNASTPDIDYLLRQTGQITKTANRLGLGVTTAAGGLEHPRTGTQAPDGTRIQNADGTFSVKQGGKWITEKK